MLSTSLASYYTPLSYIHDIAIKIRPGTYCMGDSAHALQNMASPPNECSFTEVGHGDNEIKYYGT